MGILSLESLYGHLFNVLLLQARVENKKVVIPEEIMVIHNQETWARIRVEEE